MRFLFGVFLVLLVVVIWVASSNLIQLIFHSESFDHPFFLTNIDTSLFSLYLSGFAFSKRWRNSARRSTRQVSVTDLIA